MTSQNSHHRKKQATYDFDKLLSLTSKISGIVFGCSIGLIGFYNIYIGNSKDIGTIQVGIGFIVMSIKN